MRNSTNMASAGRTTLIAQIVCPRCLRASLTREWLPILTCRRCDYRRPVSWPLGIVGMAVVCILLLNLVSVMDQLPEVIMDRIMICIIVLFAIESPFVVVMFMKERSSCPKRREEWQNLGSAELCTQLGDEDPAVRILALDYLAESPNESAFPQVVEMLGDRAVEVRQTATETLAALLSCRIGEEKAAWMKLLTKIPIPAGQAPVPASFRWRRKLEAVFPELRQKTIAALTRSGKPYASPILLEMLDGEEVETQGLAADALAWLVRVHCGEDRDEWSRLWAEEG